jgi:hypothetical protein
MLMSRVAGETFRAPGWQRLAFRCARQPFLTRINDWFAQNSNNPPRPLSNTELN